MGLEGVILVVLWLASSEWDESVAFLVVVIVVVVLVLWPVGSDGKVTKLVSGHMLDDGFFMLDDGFMVDMVVPELGFWGCWSMAFEEGLKGKGQDWEVMWLSLMPQKHVTTSQAEEEEEEEED